MTENNSKINKQEKEETVNLVQLASIVFPNLDKITAERKASKTFKRACKVLGIDPDTFKTNRDYAIPKASIKMWALLMKNIDAVEGNPSKNGFVNFIEDVIRTKNELDEQMEDITKSEADFDSFQELMPIVYEMYYTSASYGQSIAMVLHNELMQMIQQDLKYIRDNAPADRRVLYTEMYFNELKRRAERMGHLVRTMIKERWNEQ